MRQQGLRQPRAAISLVGPVPQAVAIQAHERRLAAGKESGENQQRRERAEEQT